MSATGQCNVARVFKSSIAKTRKTPSWINLSCLLSEIVWLWDNFRVVLPKPNKMRFSFLVSLGLRTEHKAVLSAAYKPGTPSIHISILQAMKNAFAILIEMKHTSLIIKWEIWNICRNYSFCVCIIWNMFSLLTTESRASLRKFLARILACKTQHCVKKCGKFELNYKGQFSWHRNV